MKRIRLTQGKVALVNDKDYEWLDQWKWCYDSNGYAVRHEQKKEYGKKPRRMVKMHRAVMRIKNSDIYLDHINKNKLDCRKENLRIVTNSQNQSNTKVWSSNKSSGYKGVHKYNEGKAQKIWGARIMVKGKSVFKGMFKDPKEAALAYNKLAIKYFGEYARLNKI